jgi:hypothetical protein
MADETLEPKRPEEESKKDTVRINLPPGLTGRGGPGTGAPPPAAKPKTPGAPGIPEEEAKKETSVMARPAEVPKPKKDTSRVQVVAAKPITADAGRPAVKLRREEEAAPEASAAAPAATPAGKGAKPAAGASSAAESALSILAIVLSVAVAGYLAYIAFGSMRPNRTALAAHLNRRNVSEKLHGKPECCDNFQRQLRPGSRQVDHARAGRFLGGMVRPVQDDRAVAR